MNKRERIMAVLRHEEPDIIPITIYTMLMPFRGYEERQLRNAGLCLVEHGFVSVYGIKTPNVKMQTTEDIASLSSSDHYACIPKQKHVVHRTYSTPVGHVSEKYQWGYALYEWPFEWAIKDLPDYRTAEYIIDDTEFFPSYEEFSSAEKIMGEDGIVTAMAPKSPLQSMLYELMGYNRFAIDYRMYRQEFDDLYRVFSKKQLEMYKVIADSPAEVVLTDENINGIVTSPKLFENYCIPFYKNVADILHRKDKIFMVHCDGKLRSLRDLIATSEIDVVEAFTPPPIGDLSIEEARMAWKEKVIWANFPATVALQTGRDRIERETTSILKSAAPGDRFALGITEDIGDIKSSRYEDVIKTITNTVTRYGTYPIAGS